MRLPQKPCTKRAARAKLDPTSLHPAPPATDQREGRTLPTNAEARVGPRRDLPHKRPPRRSAVTLARLLQHAQTAQLTRRPATHQPRPQPPEAGHLDAGATRQRLQRAAQPPPWRDSLGVSRSPRAAIRECADLALDHSGSNRAWKKRR